MMYGIGGHANVEAEVTWDNVGVSLDVGAAFGLGGGVSLDLSISPSDTIDTVGGWLGF
ncbi:hypothetical protein N1028_03575 [Herbiconiux sp. CPCC 203407]|uniref:Uncharacterized protein n=1 Tax=Herbiconiux oxytropis TaxID=2970915 RepID=A0AA41XFZ4_9MICO|nr:hypothetical protein [Herbiconiux oxytropis]MCS5724968.1 hypothetical protein [Herbiconiux oxytropis]